MSDNSSDDRFSMPPIDGIGGREPEPEADTEDDAPTEPRSLPLPPPGLFARLETPPAEDEDEDEGPLTPLVDDEPDDTETATAEPEWRLAADLDDDGDDDEDPVSPDAPPVEPVALAGVADAVDIIEQLASEWRDNEHEDAGEDNVADAPSGDELVFADAAEGIAAAEAKDDERELEDDDAPINDEPPAAVRVPAYALVTGEEEDDDDYDAVAKDPAEATSFALPMYGGERADAPDEEILPHFLLEETTPLDVVAAQDELREMAQKGRKKSSLDDDHKPSLARTLAEIPILLIVAAVIAFLVKTFVAQAYYIPSGSMLPQLDIDDRVVVSKLAYKTHDPRRGDIIVFDDPKTGQSTTEADGERSGVSKVLRKIGEGVGVVQPSTDEFIKRVVALPGETVEGRDGFVYINERKLIEPYLPEGIRTEDFAEQTVAEGKLWVMGDNRSGSADSRVFGQIDVDSIVGRAVVKVWPFSHISFL